MGGLRRRAFSCRSPIGHGHAEFQQGSNHIANENGGVRRCQSCTAAANRTHGKTTYPHQCACEPTLGQPCNTHSAAFAGFLPCHDIHQRYIYAHPRIVYVSSNEAIDIEVEMKVVTSNLGRILQLVSEDFVKISQPEIDEQIRLSRLILSEIRRITVRSAPKKLKDELRKQANRQVPPKTKFYGNPSAGTKSQ